MYMTDKIKIFEYKGNAISFETEGNKFVNITEMAKSFPELRRPVNQFFRNKQTANFINALHNLLKNSHDDNSRIEKIRSFNATNLAKQFPELIKTSQGGNVTKLPTGTWVHEKIALKFAAYLDPYFELWIYGVIQELFTNDTLKEIEVLKWHLKKLTDNADNQRNLLDTIPFQDESRKRIK